MNAIINNVLKIGRAAVSDVNKTVTIKTKTKAEAYTTKTKKNTLVRVQHEIHEWQFTMQYTIVAQ